MHAGSPEGNIVQGRHKKSITLTDRRSNIANIHLLTFCKRCKRISAPSALRYFLVSLVDRSILDDFSAATKNARNEVRFRSALHPPNNANIQRDFNSRQTHLVLGYSVPFSPVPSVNDRASFHACLTD